MKKLICMVLMLVLVAGTACATILDPRGVDLEYKLNTGIEAKRAEVLCKSLSALEAPNTRARKVKTFSAGQTFLTWQSEDIFLNCFYSYDHEPAWVRDYYVLVDPHYYRTDSGTPVYAYGSTSAPRVGLTDTGDVYPIIMENDHWVVISIRGASGWIRKNNNDYVHQCWLQPETLVNLKRAELFWSGNYYVASDRYTLDQISALISDVEPRGHASSNCPFGPIHLTLTTQDNERITVQIASDNCAIMRVSGYEFKFGVSSYATRQQLTRLFPGCNR